MTEDWNDPLNVDGPSRSAALRRAVGVTTPELTSLISELNQAISCSAWGFAQLADLDDLEQRALVSDQLLSAADGTLEALLDAAISAREVSEYTGPTGLPYPDAADSLNDMMRLERLRRAVASFFDAIGTTLDCMAAVLVVITRAPLSVQRADFAQLSRLDATKPYATAFANPVPQHQRDRWSELVVELDEATAVGPNDWLQWSLEMRNALTHRGRVTDVYLPRKISGQLAVPPTSEPQKLYRYDLHLRRRPWLPAIEGMLAGPGLPNSWVDEPAGRTIDGLRDALVKYCERLAHWTTAHWSNVAQEGLVAPVLRWKLPAAPLLTFDGVRPGNTTPIQGAIGNINEEHLRLAERLRRRRAGLPDA